jgi:hypothetical protein
MSECAPVGKSDELCECVGALRAAEEGCMPALCTDESCCSL